MESLRLHRPSHRGFRTLPSSYSDSSRQQQRNIVWKVLKQICARIKKSVVVKNLKAENPQEPLLGENTNWLHNSQIPADRGTPEEPSYRICQPNSMSMKIYVKFPSNRKTLVLEAKGYNIINDIKSMIRSKEGVQSGQYSLVCRGKLLEGYQTLASLDIQTESTLYMIFNPIDVMSIFEKIPSGKMVKFEVKVFYTVRDIKTIVESFIGCPLTECSMIYAGNELQDCKTLDFYEVEENSTLEVLPFWFQIFIKTWSGKTITLDVTRRTTVREVKDEIFCKVRVPVYVQSIVVAGKRLDDECRLSSYAFQKGSTSHGFGLVNQIPLSFIIHKKCKLDLNFCQVLFESFHLVS